jgi:hypothetical protein
MDLGVIHHFVGESAGVAKDGASLGKDRGRKPLAKSFNYAAQMLD